MQSVFSQVFFFVEKGFKNHFACLFFSSGLFAKKRQKKESENKTIENRKPSQNNLDIRFWFRVNLSFIHSKIFVGLKT